MKRLTYQLVAVTAVAIGILAAMFVFLTPAYANSIPLPSAPDGQMWELTNLGVKWWEKRDVRTCAQVIPDISVPETIQWETEEQARQYKKNPMMLRGWATIGSCRAALTPHFARETRGNWWGTMYELALECSVMFHEIGHALGITHQQADVYPVMSEDDWDMSIPGKCWGWAKKIRKQRTR